MNVVLGFVLIVLLGYAGSRLTLFQQRFSLGVRYLFTAGTEFLLVGLILGPRAANLLTDAALHDLSPVLSLGLGWIGLLVGVQFDRRILKQIALRIWTLAFVVSLTSFALLALFVYFFLPLCFRWSGDLGLMGIAELENDSAARLGAACLLGWAGSVSTYSAMALIQRDSPLRGKASKLLQLLTDLRAPLAVLGMGAWYALFHASTEAMTLARMHNEIDTRASVTTLVDPVMSGTGWLLVSVLLGVSLGWLLHYLTSERLSGNEMLLLVAGSVIFSGGLSSYLQLSPLFVNLVMGLMIANLPNFALGRITKSLLTAEKPFFVIFMILVGALWPPITPAVLMMAAAYVIARAAALIAGTWLGRAGWPHGEKPAPWLGLAMLPSGGLSIALAVDYHLIRPGYLANFLLGTIILSVLINQLIGPFLMERVLRASGAKTPEEKKRAGGDGRPAPQGAPA